EKVSDGNPKRPRFGPVDCGPNLRRCRTRPMLDPQARALIDLMIEKQVPAVHTLSPAEARRFYRDRRFFTQPEPPALAEVRDLSMPGPGGALPLRFYRPAATSAGHTPPLLVYFHGGGWTIGDLDTHDVL